METLRELLSQLGPGGDRLATLEAVKPALGSLSRKEAEDGLKVSLFSNESGLKKYKKVIPYHIQRDRQYYSSDVMLILI